MTAGWEKLGLLVPPPANGGWRASHAMVPFATTDPEGLTVWFSARDEEGKSRTGRATVNLDSPGEVDSVDGEPVLDVGSLGAFDENGAMGSCLVEVGGRRHLYYIGWQPGRSVPFATFIGCAVSEDGGPFRKVSDGPVIGRSTSDPYLATSPWVLVENGMWRMWYASGTGWSRDEDEEPRHHYRITYAESDDGIEWRPTGRACIDYEGDDYAIARPCVVKDGDRYRMWFSHRGGAYRIGYAESADGLEWARMSGPLELEPSAEGWDSEMVEYPFVFDHEDRRYMLYNGNGYGETGIGLAVLGR